MIDRFGLRCLGLALVGLAAAGWGRAHADFETDLLRKFQQQNQQGARDVKAEVEKNVVLASALGSVEPARSLELVRLSRVLLDTDRVLPRADRDALARRLDEVFHHAKERQASLDEEARRRETIVKPIPLPEKGSVTTYSTDAGKNPKLAVSPIVFQPNIVPMIHQAQFQTTPVVSPDRRWVRINVSGVFAIGR